MGTISTMALLQNIIDTEVNAKRYAESNALIKEPFEVCPPNRVAAMHRTVALQESLRAEGALRDHTYPFYRRFWNQDDLMSRQNTPELWNQQVHQVAAVNDLAARAQPDMTERQSTNQALRQEANSKFEAGVAGYAHLVAQRQAAMDQNLQTNAGLPMEHPSMSYPTAPAYGMYGYQGGYVHPHAAFDP